MAVEGSIPKVLSVRVLIVGASGFIGTHLARVCAASGHEVICGSRHPAGLSCTQHLQIDYAADALPDFIASELSGVDVLVNAVGILRPRGRQTFEALHVRGPTALFSAAVAAGVRRIIQISALGADPRALSAYHRSKSEADRALMLTPYRLRNHSIVDNYGMGWFIDTHAGRQFAFHGGGTPGITAMEYIVPTRHVAVIAFFNLENIKAAPRIELMTHLAEAAGAFPKAKS